MEILIIGVIIVALMAYVSTRIKKNAAMAFEPERIETKEFSLVKPEGFLNPVDNKPGLAFYAYSKDYGIENTAKFRQSEINLRVYDYDNLKQTVENAKRAAVKIISEGKNGNGEVLLSSETTEDKAVFERDYKFVSKNGKIYELQVKSLQETKDLYTQRIAEVLESFTVK